MLLASICIAGTTIDRTRLAVTAGCDESVTVIVTRVLLGDLGTPVIAPALDSVRPVGSTPDVSLNFSGRRPAFVRTCAE
jgi:hypothetical protein